MSTQGQAWVDKVGIKGCKNSGELLVLIRVGNHVGGDMRGCFAKAATLAEECLMGESTVLKHLRALKAAGVLLPGDAKLVSHIRADKRPPVYDLAGGHESGCPGGHPSDVLCETVMAAGARSEHPPKGAPATGARSEHPPKKRRSAGVRSEHPTPDAGVTGVQIDASRVFKSSGRSNKEVKLPLSVPAGGLNGLSSSGSPSQDERENLASPEGTSPVPAAAESATAAVVVEAWTNGMKAGGRQLLPKRAAAIGAEAAELLAAGHDLDHLCRVAEWMGRVKPTWKVLEDAMTYPDAPQLSLPAPRPAPKGPATAMCVQHPAFIEGDCPRCRLAERERQQRSGSGPAPIDGAGLLARLRAGQPV
ncbi:hypothetical protein ACH4ZX_36705 [Streptomyces sp. NPDC020490]|uniref:hypothetical protein n=1 Tax=Streptomyces sp. NPDC020490 TaxID=3365078 RepID=UPI0037BA304D